MSKNASHGKWLFVKKFGKNFCASSRLSDFVQISPAYGKKIYQGIMYFLTFIVSNYMQQKHGRDQT